jgi:secreted PhoX family phosphatase
MKNSTNSFSEDSAMEKGLSRKQFLNFTGKSIAVGSLVFAGVNQNTLSAQTSEASPSTSGREPAQQQEPIVLEKWKSDVDQQSGPVPTPLPPNQRIRYAVVGLGHLALEEILPALSTCKKSKLTALVS